MSRLQAHLTGRILAHVREQGIVVGGWLSENSLAHAFGVSRTPIRGALAALTKLGILSAVPRKGYLLRRAVSEQELQEFVGAADDDERIIEHVAADRLAGVLPDQVSETNLLRRYRLTRRTLARVLNRMAQDSVIERRSGNGWRFLPALDSAQMHAESYRFRGLVEPACLLEPGFRLDRARARRIRDAHVELLAAGPRQLTPRRFLDLDAQFYQFVASCSGNRFLEQAVLHQSHLRRFFSHLVSHDPQRARIACSAHVAILERLLEGEMESAATLLRRHLFNMSQYRARAVRATPA